MTPEAALESPLASRSPYLRLLTELRYMYITLYTDFVKYFYSHEMLLHEICLCTLYLYINLLHEKSGKLNQ